MWKLTALSLGNIKRLTKVTRSAFEKSWTIGGKTDDAKEPEE
ncbi:hypothetical protein PG5_27820 [Pseudomonas sp. G5(2012)]|nr:hypothetical protein PG5_27820 [Pseudomonas sp. G5(2012)]